MRILFAGDLTASGRIKDILLRRDFGRIMPDVIPLINDVDYSVVNLEAPIVRKGIGAPIPKVGPHLSAPVEMLEFLNYAGIKCVTLANNHILDFGDDALIDTLSILDEKRIDYVGAGKNLEDASRVLVRQIGDRKIAIVNVCEIGFNMATESTPGAYPLDVVKNVRQIQFAKANANYVAVIVHGGVEMFRLPTPQMKDLYRFFIDVGADVVVAHHQHCCSGYEMYNNRPIFYGLGNLCMDRESYPNLDWYYGFLVIVDFSNEVSFEIIPYCQNLHRIGVYLLHGEEKHSLLRDIDDLSNTIVDDHALQTAFSCLVKEKEPQVLFRFSRYSGKAFAVLAQKGLLNVRLGTKRSLRIFEYLSNDSHREIAQAVLSSSRKN